MTTALVISGGGDKGAFAVGVIEVLVERGYEFDLVAGTSTGALIAPLLAINDIDEMVRIYTSVRKKDILRLNWRRLFLDAIYDTWPLEKLIRKTMRGERYDRLMASSIKILLCSVGFQSGSIRYASQHPVGQVIGWSNFDGYVAATLASTNQPMLMPPSVWAGESCFDGGVREVAPLKVALELGATQVIVIANSPEDPGPVEFPQYRMVTIGPRALDLMTTEILNNDLSLGGADVTVIRPKEILPSDGLHFIPVEMQEMRTIGQNRAREILG